MATWGKTKEKGKKWSTFLFFTSCPHFLLNFVALLRWHNSKEKVFIFHKIIKIIEVTNYYWLKREKRKKKDVYVIVSLLQSTKKNKIKSITICVSLTLLHLDAIPYDVRVEWDGSPLRPLCCVRTYVFHMLGSYVTILCNWLIL